MVMERKKIILVMMIVGLFVAGIAIGASIVYLITRTDNDVPPVYIEATVPVTEEQYQFLREEIISWELENLNSIRRRNAWLILDTIASTNFSENTLPGQSRVGFATRILEMLDIGEIQELTVVRLDYVDYGFNYVLIMRITNKRNNIYYLYYSQYGGLGVVKRGNEDGEMIYNSAIHTIRDGQLCEREVPRGPIISCR